MRYYWYRSPGPLPQDVVTQIDTHGQDQVKNSELFKDKTIAYAGAEKSCLDQLAKIRAQQEKMSPKKPAVKTETREAHLVEVPPSPGLTPPQTDIGMAEAGSRKKKAGYSEDAQRIRGVLLRVIEKDGVQCD